MDNHFMELHGVDCSKHVEKKGRFSYLSWPFAISELSKRHPDAVIEVHEWDGLPYTRANKGWLVKVSVTINGVTRTQWHPILDSNNKAIVEPDVFQINTSIQRATVKAIALHGLGLYIYAGEDLPEGAEPEKPQKQQAKPQQTAPAPRPANPNAEKIATYQANLIAEAKEYGVVPADSDGVTWFTEKAKAAAAKVGKKSAAMTAEELEQFFQIITDSATDDANKAKEAANA